jgi:hypothetical protein
MMEKKHVTRRGTGGTGTTAAVGVHELTAAGETDGRKTSGVGEA